MPRHLLPLTTVLAVAFAARLPQLLLSSLPLNIDSFAQIAIADGLLDTGQWELDEASPNAGNLKMPILPMLLATSSTLLGVDPLSLATPLMILVSLVGVLGMYALTYYLTGRRSIALVAALVLALLGPYIFLSSTLIKEALALAFLPVLVWLTLGRQDPRMRVLAAGLLLTLPLIHPLSTLMAFGFVALILLLHHVRRYWAGRWSWRVVGLDLFTGPALFSFALWYYAAVGLENFQEVWRPDEVALFLSVALLVAAGAILLSSQKRARPWFAVAKTHRGASLLDQKSVAIVGALLLVAVNFVRPLVPGTVATTPSLLLIAFAYLPLVFLGLIGLNLFRLSPRRAKIVPIALLLAPFTVILYALLRGLTPQSHVLLYRSFDFFDFGIALTVGMALVVGVRRRRRPVLAGVVVASLLATLPLAYASETVFQVQNTTYGYELAVLQRVSESGVVAPATDQRLGDVLTMYFGVEGSSVLPLTLLYGSTPGPGSLLLLEGNWATRGAQVHPLPFLPLGEARFAGILEGNHLVYHGGDSANGVYAVVMRG